jgi:nucleotide-binding universal stress UspA family protein
MKKILVPCDFSKTAQQAYTFALDIAKKNDAEVYVLKVIDIPFMYESYSVEVPASLNPELWKQIENDARASFNKMKGEHSSRSEITFRTVKGPVTPGILDFIDKEKIDLVVMGTSGSSGLDEFLVGSNTEKIVRFSKVPVFAIRKAINLSSIKNIVYPTNLSQDQERIADRLKAVQTFFDATLHILVVDTPFNMKRKHYETADVEKFVSLHGFQKCTVNVRRNYSEEGGILDFVAEIGADMIAMSTHGRRGLSRLFGGSITENVVNHIDLPVWTFSLHK